MLTGRRARHHGFVVENISRSDDDGVDGGVLNDPAPVVRDEFSLVLTSCRLETIAPPSAKGDNGRIISCLPDVRAVLSADESGRPDDTDAESHLRTSRGLENGNRSHHF